MSKTIKSKKPQRPALTKPTSPPAKKAFQAGSDPLAVAPARVAGVAATLASFVPAVATYDDDAARGLVETYRPRLAAIEPERVLTPRLDVDAAARALVSAHATATQAPGLHAQLAQLHAAGQLDLACVDGLADLGFVLMHAHREATLAGAFKSNAKIPPALDTTSAALEAEMQSVCEHNFGEHPEHGPLLEILRPGTSYLDRANDLLGYARIYEAEPAVVAQDTKYRKTHLADARKVAGEILAALGASMTPQAREWYDLLQRAWTLASKMYFEVQQASLFLLRYDPRRAERFPSLYVVARGGGPKKGKKPVAASSAPATPAEQ